jgi:hypothetical protein
VATVLPVLRLAGPHLALALMLALRRLARRPPATTVALSAARRPAARAARSTALRRRVGGAVAVAAGAAGACAACAALCDSGSGSPFVYPELTAATERRIVSAQRLMEYMRSTQQVIGALQLQMRTGSLGTTTETATEAYWARMRELQEEVALETQKILYGVEEKGARAAYEAEFGCVRWTEPALKIIAGLSPVRGLSRHSRAASCAFPSRPLAL